MQLLRYLLFVIELENVFFHALALAGIRWLLRRELEKKWWFFASEVLTSTTFLVFFCPAWWVVPIVVSHIVLHVVYTAPWFLTNGRPDGVGYWKRMVDWGSVEYVGKHEGSLEWFVIGFDLTCHVVMAALLVFR